jgi:hypothetical protein
MLKELDIKQALKTDKSKTQSPLYKIHKKDNSTIVVDEMCINNSSVRADVVAINDELHCFEIKSDVDTFKRLENQMNNYLEIFDKIYFITTEKHITKITGILPDCVGVYVIQKKNRNISFEEFKKPFLNDKRNTFKVLNLLWNVELKHLIKSLQIKGFTKMQNQELYEKILDLINEKELHFYIRSILKMRSQIANWKVNQTKELYDEYALFLSTHQNSLFLRPPLA